MRTAMSLVLLMIFAPLVQAIESPYIGDSEIIVQSNGDGTLSKEELDVAEEISEEEFNEMDADGDGSISKDEFEAAAEKEEE